MCLQVPEEAEVLDPTELELQEVAANWCGFWEINPGPL